MDRLIGMKVITCPKCFGMKSNIFREKCIICNDIGSVVIDKKDNIVKEDMVNHPKHYTFGKIEVITVIDDWKLGFYEGQVVKYVGRAKHKGNELQDLKKAQWYLNRLIDQKEK